MTSIFIKNLTILDAAILDATHGPVGQSWYVDVVLTGPKNEEGVVVDFAKGKKRVKEIIDEAFDHRLFVSEGHFRQSGARALVTLKYPDPENSATNLIFALDTYEKGLVVFASRTSTDTPQLRDIEAAIEAAVLNAMSTQLTQVKITMRPHELRTAPHYFTYTHSLRHHDGYCQRFHGHSNIVEVLKDGEFDAALSATVAAELNGCYLVSEDYIFDASDAVFAELNTSLGKEKCDVAGVRYQGSQGEVFALVPRNKLMVLPAESTIENISDFIKTTLLQNDPHLQVIAYEGIQKGALSS